tara:strand:+ start:567 stop:1415 length:849 start_codon:yes stop_codon:yes gene_type:complete
MNSFQIKSYAKINLSLGVLGKLESKLHKIESIISFINLYDNILVKKIKSKKHKIIFSGKFSKRIPRKNTISNLLKILDKRKKLKNQKYLIKINKKIPQKSGMGGGSMNAASVLKFLIYKQRIKLNSNEILKVTSKIGSDVFFGMQRSNLLVYSNGHLKKINKNLNLYTLLVKPNTGCSTKKIYKSLKFYSRSVFKKNMKINLNYRFIAKLKNDLEDPAFKKYPFLKKIKIFMENIDDILFVRMTGSGSTIIGYFKSKKAALLARKIIKKNYKNYWCILSKTI